MANSVLLNNVDHADLRVVARQSADTGAAANQVAVFPTEFEGLARDLPIMFRRGAAGSFEAFAMLGFAPGENLFLGSNGWTGRHIPALFARGPFSIGIAPDGAAEAEPTIRIDLDDSRVGSDPSGYPLFLPHGGNAPYLDHVADILQTIHQGIAVAKPMFAAWDAHGLIEPTQIEVHIDDEERYRVPDCHAIDQDRLATLDAGSLDALHREGFLRPAFAATWSLANMSRLIDMKRAR